MEVSVARIQKGRRVEPEVPALSIACSQPPSNPPLLYLGWKPKIQVSQSHTPSRGWKRGSFPPVPASGDPGDPGLAATALQSLPPVTWPSPLCVSLLFLLRTLVIEFWAHLIRNALIFSLYIFYLFVYLWLRWVFIAARELSLVAVSRSYSSLSAVSFSLWGFSRYRAQALGAQASVVAACRLSNCGSQAQELWWHTGLVALQHVGSSQTRD